MTILRSRSGRKNERHILFKFSYDRETFNKRESSDDHARVPMRSVFVMMRQRAN